MQEPQKKQSLVTGISFCEAEKFEKKEHNLTQINSQRRNKSSCQQ